MKISLDNLDMVTSPLRHYFFTREILDAGVLFNAVSPRFNGNFHIKTISANWPDIIGTLQKK